MCAKCGKQLGNANKSGLCTPCQRPNRKAAAASEDSVLDRMGFGQGSEEHPVKSRGDEAPPKEPKKPRAKPGPKPKSEPVQVPLRRGRWEEQFRSLAGALGLDPDEMLERYCREWVETTRTRALNANPVATAPTNGVTPLQAIGDDYERARTQAEG